MNIPRNENPRIVVVGGGFAGISLIRKLKRKPYQIVLLDRHNYHTFQPLLYQVSTSGLEPDSIAFPLRKIFKHYSDFHFRMATVEKIIPENKEVVTSIGIINYDYLVIATGSKTNYFGNKSIAHFAMPMKTVPQALNIRSLILESLEKAVITNDKALKERLMNFVVVGAGPTGVELAGALAEFKKLILSVDYPNLSPDDMQIHLIEGANRVLASMSKFASAKAEKFLRKMDVNIYLNTFVNSYDGNVVLTNTGLTINTETLIWSAGVTGYSLNGFNPSAFFERTNRYKVDGFNKVMGYENVYAIGDIAYMATKKYPNGHPMVAQPAIQQGKNLGANFIRMQKGKPLKPFEYKDKGAMATVGRNKAVVDFKRIHSGGFFAWFLWMFVHLWFLVGFRNRMVTFINWIYNYINFDQAARLIIRPYLRQKEKESSLK